MKKDYDSDSKVTRHLKRFLENIIIITPISESFYTGSNADPTLKETKGKIVLFNRMGGTYIKSGYGADTSGIQWADNATFETKINNGSLNLKVQDEYKDYYDKKLKLLKIYWLKLKRIVTKRQCICEFLECSVWVAHLIVLITMHHI